MAVLPIIKAPDPRLKRHCKAVGAVDGVVRRLMDDMLETMYGANGIGLAAPQVGVAKRIVVLDLAREEEDPAPLRMADPKIVWSSEEEKIREEGCLSLPDQWADVTRPESVRVSYIDHENEIREIEASGMLATCIQHEMDHLDGVLFVDHLSALKRKMILRKLTKAQKAAETVSV